MAVINVLSKQVAELIAAGEVIERPASVIKELVENAIDAGADSITVEIKNGGITFMRVTDNGCGIERDDIRNAFLRHATSKIKEQDDLDSIATLGFRGEALASICAVSRVELMTRSRNEEFGTLYRLEGGQETLFTDAGCPKGTTFVVRDLFFNVPARMKFLKKDVAEANSISGLMDRIALSHPEIGFTLIRDGKQILKTSGKGDQSAAIFQVFGRQFAEGLIPVSYQYQGITLSGYVSKPVSANRASRSMQTFFVNGRYVRTKTGMAALEQAYKGFIMVGRFPACVLNLELDCAGLDVNVHPAKLEIRFTNERPVYECIYHGVRTAISQYDTRNQTDAPTPSGGIDPRIMGRTSDKGSQIGFGGINLPVSPTDKEKKDEPEVFMPSPADFDSMPVNDPGAAPDFYRGGNVRIRPINLAEYRSGAYSSGGTGTNTSSDTAAASDDGNESDAGALSTAGTAPFKAGSPAILPAAASRAESLPEAGDKGGPQKEMPAPVPEEPVPIVTELSEREPDAAQAFPMLEADESDISPGDIKGHSLTYIGEAFRTYIIVQYDSQRLMFIDKHAAHERLIYERLKRTHKVSGPQLLLEPVVITLDKAELMAVTENKELLMDAGFEAEEFGSSAVILRSVPLMLEKLDKTEAFLEIARYLAKHDRLVLSEKMEWIYANTACRAAIKAGDKNDPMELMELVRELERNPEVKYCPHGRPIWFFMSRRDMEKNFKRI